MTLALVLAPLSGLAAAALVVTNAHTARGRSLWWAGTLAAAAAASLGAFGPAPVAVAVAGTGLAAAAVVDAAERRVPTPIAHGTAFLSLAALGVHAWRSAAWTPLLVAVLLTALVAVLCAGLWLSGRLGFGDVRLAATTVTGALGGPAGAVALLSGAFVTAGCTAVVRRRRGARASGVSRASGRLPFAPALAAGWLLAVVAT